MDAWLLHLLNDFAFRHDGFEDPVSFYEKVSEVLFAVGVLGLLVLPGRGVAWRRRAGVAAGLSAALALLVGKVVSLLVDRPRPFVEAPGRVHLFHPHAADAGFPSDHATAAFAIAVAVLLVRRGPGIAALVAAVVLAAGRVVIGVHYPSDVLAGAALGAAAATLVHHVGPLRAVVDAITRLLVRPCADPSVPSTKGTDAPHIAPSPASRP